MRCLHKRNRYGGFVGQHRRFCGKFGCDNDAVNHVAVGSHWCANLCNACTKYYRTRRDSEVTEGLTYIEEDESGTKRSTIATR